MLLVARQRVHPAQTLFARMGAYSHPVLLNRMESELALLPAEARALFADVKRFLSVAATSSESIAPTPAIDSGWHQFVLFTEDYAAFCREYCGRFIHHRPENPFAIVKDMAAIPRTRDLATEIFGPLSGNWYPCGRIDSDCSSAADCCPPSCQGKDCSPGDCTSCKTA